MTETLLRGAGPRALTAPAPGVEARLVCTRVEEVTHDVRSFDLSPVDGATPAFDPGQYLTLTVEVDGVEVQRCYTIASSPTRRGPWTITVKRVPGGPVSNWLHDHLTEGDIVRATGPYGLFSIANHPAPKYLFLSAGSGITPLMSMTRTLRDHGEQVDVVFVHSARTPRDIIFAPELETLATHPGMVVTSVCEEASASDGWDGETGRLTLRTLLRYAPDLHEREVFTCGPPGYMRSVRDILETAGVDPERCHEESFDLAARGPADVEPERAGSAQRYTVEFRRSGCRFDCDADDTVLRAALRAGLSPPSMCTEGMCGTCKSTLVDGQVDMRHAGGIRPREIARGEILICCSKPLGDLVIDA